MFTSRAEFRLYLRADNADQRLTEKGYRIGCVSDARHRVFEGKMAGIDELKRDLSDVSLDSRSAGRFGIKISGDGSKRSGMDLLGYPDVTMAQLSGIWPFVGTYPETIQKQVENDGRYANYIERQRSDVKALKRDEALVIPAEFAFEGLGGMSSEILQKLSLVRPTSIGQASRIEGMTPAALSLLAIAVKKGGEKKRA